LLQKFEHRPEFLSACGFCRLDIDKFAHILESLLCSKRAQGLQLSVDGKTLFMLFAAGYASHAARAMEILESRKSVFREASEIEIALKGFWKSIEAEDFAEDAVRTAISTLADSFISQTPIDSQLRKDYSPRHFADWLFAIDGFSVTYSVSLDGKDLQLLSPGEKGIVLLLLYLEAESEDNRPLIIDQPDDNRDNLSVYPSLIDYFRVRKTTRQIIIITHNPNLVINTDAEQVLVARFDGSSSPKIVYRAGSLEDTNPSGPIVGIREEACKILEGGTKAFQLREQRYSIG
jgi:hypothetical protein